MYKLFVIVIYFFPQLSYSQRNTFFPGWVAYSNTFMDVFSWETNPAFLAKSSGFKAGIHSQQYFQLQGLNEYSFSTNFKAGNDGLALGGAYFGNENYSEWSLSSGFGKTLGKISAGICFQYESFTIPGYGGAGKITAGLGSVLRLSDQLNTGIYITIPKHLNHIAATGNNSGINYSFGIGFEPSTAVAVCLILKKQKGNAFNAEATAMYTFNHAFFTSAGISSSTGTVMIGAGWRLERFIVQVNCSIQQYIGTVPGILVEYVHKNKDE